MAHGLQKITKEKFNRFPSPVSCNSLTTGQGRSLHKCTNRPGAVASCPQRALQAETLLKGEKPNAELIETSAIAAAKLAKPMDNTDMTLGYRKKMAANFVKDAINEALGQ